MKVPLIVSAITVVALGMLYVVAQPTHAEEQYQTGDHITQQTPPQHVK